MGQAFLPVRFRDGRNLSRPGREPVPLLTPKFNGPEPRLRAVFILESGRLAPAFLPCARCTSFSTAIDSQPFWLKTHPDRHRHLVGTPVHCELYPFVFFLLRKTCSNDAPSANPTITKNGLKKSSILCISWVVNSRLQPRQTLLCHLRREFNPQLLPSGSCFLSRCFQSPATPEISSLECALTSKHRVLPGFGRNRPSVTPLECALTKKGGGGQETA